MSPSEQTLSSVGSKRVLIVAPHFPPATLAGVHRPRHLAKWLPKHGWTPIVIRVDERFYTETLDPALAQLVPDTVIQERTAAITANATRTFGVSDVGLRGYFYLKRAIEKAARRHAPRVVLITGSPYYPMLLSGWIKTRLGLPVVLDFQDPWVSAWGAGLPRWSKGRLAHRLAVALEPRAVRHAAYVTSVSDRQNEEMASRYDWLDSSRMAGIPIGGDPEDFGALRSDLSSRPRADHLDRTKLNLSYVGTFLPRAEPVVRQLFRALSQLKRHEPTVATKVRLNFIGTSNQPDGQMRTVQPVAASEGVADLVTETPQRVPFLEALDVLANSRGLLLIGSDEPHYTASKIYPALMSERPYLSLFHEQSSAHSILSDAGGGQAFGFACVETLEALVPDIASALRQVVVNPEVFGQADPASYAHYTADRVAARFVRVFEEMR